MLWVLHNVTPIDLLAQSADIAFCNVCATQHVKALYKSRRLCYCNKRRFYCACHPSEGREWSALKFVDIEESKVTKNS